MKIFKLFKLKRKKAVKIDHHTNDFGISEKEADELLGGFKEYQPSIYTQNQNSLQLSTKDLFVNSNYQK